MKNSKNPHTIAGQSNCKVPKSRKHDANLQKNTTLYFQIGLILCLLGTYSLFEMRFETTKYEGAIVYVDPDNEVFHMPNIVVEPDAPKKVEVKTKKRVIIEDPVIVDDDTKIAEPTELTTDPPITSEPVVNPKTPVAPEPPETPEFFTLKGVEVVPIYPGCEKMTTNEDRIKCMNKKISKLVQRKFDTDIASEYGLSGKQRINVQFKIDQNGLVSEIMARAPHPSLEKEAQRVTNKIPQMQPGLQQKVPVSVVYNLPIVFKVN